MTVALALLGTQIGLVWLIWRLSVVGTHEFAYRALNPFTWLCAFYTLWFLVPQVTGLFGEFHMLGMTSYRTDDLRQIFVEGQLYLILFLLAIVAAQLLMAPVLLELPGRASLPAMLGINFSTSYSFFLYAFFAVGMAGNAYVAHLQVGNLDSFRGDIVKTLPGQAATALGYLGAFAFVYLFARLYLKGQYVWLVILSAIFVVSLFMTGARGRMMFPLAIVALFLLCRRGNMPVVRTVFLAAISLCVLLALDPINKVLKFGPDTYVLTAEEFFSPLLYKRNFDGFANFSLIVSHDLVPYDVGLLKEGGRDAFMYTYFPRLYATGVGTGSTTPGLFWFLGGWPALMIAGMAFGMILCMLNIWLRLNRSNLLLWSYLFGMQWFCAIGGNLIESLDKMLVAMVGPLIIYLAHGRAESRLPVPEPLLPAMPSPQVSEPEPAAEAGDEPALPPPPIDAQGPGVETYGVKPATRTSVEAVMQ